MNKLVQYKERTVEQGFTFQKGWWGEFSPTGELVIAYLYPVVDVNRLNKWEWSYSWEFAKIAYPMDGGFVVDLVRLDKLPEQVIGDFHEVAEQEMLDQVEEAIKWAEWEEEDNE